MSASAHVMSGPENVGAQGREGCGRRDDDGCVATSPTNRYMCADAAGFLLSGLRLGSGFDKLSPVKVADFADGPAFK